MLIPAGVVELDEAHVALGEPARQQAIRRVGTRNAGFFAVKVVDVIGFAGQIDDLGHRRLHPVGHLVLVDARFDVRVVPGVGLEFVELLDDSPAIAGGAPHRCLRDC